MEGYREIRRALEKNVKLAEMYSSPEWFLGENEPALIEQARAAGAQVDQPQSLGEWVEV